MSIIKSPVEELFDRVESEGVAVATVSDGHVLVLTTKVLENLLEQSRQAGKVVLFVKREVTAGNA